MSVQDSRLLNALQKKAVDSTPVWLMRQAGRYLPEYREARKSTKNFVTMCQTPALAAEVTLQPLQRFDLDAAIIFSDILVIPHAMGMELDFVQGEGPQLNAIRTDKEIAALKPIVAKDDLAYVLEAISLVIKDLPSHIPLIGFCGSPWTVACYMIEGQTSKTFSQIKKWAFSSPSSLKLLLQKVTDASIDYLKAQVHSGARVLQIFDSWGGILGLSEYKTFSLQYMQQMVDALKEDESTAHVPIILFSKGANHALADIANTGCQGISIDWTQDLAQAKTCVGDKVVLQGNLDPCYLYAPANVLQEKVRAILSVYDHAPGHIFNLGHGIYPDIPVEGVQTLIETIRAYS